MTTGEIEEPKGPDREKKKNEDKDEETPRKHERKTRKEIK